MHASRPPEDLGDRKTDGLPCWFSIREPRLALRRADMRPETAAVAPLAGPVAAFAAYRSRGGDDRARGDPMSLSLPDKTRLVYGLREPVDEATALVDAKISTLETHPPPVICGQGSRPRGDLDHEPGQRHHSLP